MRINNVTLNDLFCLQDFHVQSRVAIEQQDEQLDKDNRIKELMEFLC